MFKCVVSISAGASNTGNTTLCFYYCLSKEILPMPKIRRYDLIRVCISPNEQAWLVLIQMEFFLFFMDSFLVSMFIHPRRGKGCLGLILYFHHIHSSAVTVPVLNIGLLNVWVLQDLFSVKTKMKRKKWSFAFWGRIGESRHIIQSVKSKKWTSVSLPTIFQTILTLLCSMPLHARNTTIRSRKGKRTQYF